MELVSDATGIFIHNLRGAKCLSDVGVTALLKGRWELCRKNSVRTCKLKKKHHNRNFYALKRQCVKFTS